MRPLITAVLLLAAAAPSAAAELRHRLGADESLADVARNYYGSSWKAVYLEARNGIEDVRKVDAGTSLIIPACWIYKVRRGDSPVSIAKRYLGDSERYFAVMQANGVRDASELEVGTELLMPFHLFHTVAQGDSWSRISRRYYRSTRYGAMLEEYNGGTELKPGRRLTIPILDRSTLDVRSRYYNPWSDTAKRQSAQKPAPKRNSGGNSGARLKDALAGYRRGEFISSCGSLEELLEEAKLEGQERIQLVSHLGFCAVALGDRSAARDYFHTWLELNPSASLSPITTSPKILAVFEEVAEDRKKSRGASQ